MSHGHIVTELVMGMKDSCALSESMRLVAASGLTLGR